jgi:hypothetical protein
VIALLAAGPAAAVAATAPSTEPGLTVTIEATTIELDSPDQVLTIAGSVANHTEQTLEGDVNLRIALDPFTSLIDLNAWTTHSPEALEDTTWRAAAIGSQSLAPGATLEFTLEVTAGDLNLGNRGNEPGWGPRGFAVDFETAENSVAQVRGYIIYAPAGTVRAAVRLTVAAPLTAASGETSSQALARAQQIARATPQPVVSWLIDPELLAQEAGIISPADHPLAEAVRTGLTAGKAVYAVPYGDLDVVGLAQVQPQPTQLLAEATALGQATLEETLGAQAAGQVRTDTAWTIQPVDAHALTFLAASGFEYAVVPANQLSHIDTALHGTVQVAAAAESITALVPDTYLETVLNGSDPLDVDHLRLELSWLAAQAQATGSPAWVTTVLPRAWSPLEGTKELLDELAATEWVTFAGLPNALSAPEVATVTPAGAADTTPGATGTSLNQLGALTDRAYAFAQLTADPTGFVDQLLPVLLQPWSTASPPGPERQAAVDQALAQMAAAVPELEVVTGSDVNLISQDGRIPVTVTNPSQLAVTNLVVSLNPSTRAIRPEGTVTVNIEPGGTVTARVPVHALANGAFEVAVELSNTAGQAVAEPAIITMRVRAEWEDWVTAIFTGGFALIMIYGLVTTVHKRRQQVRDRRQVKILLAGGEPRSGATGAPPAAASDGAGAQ